MNPCGAKYNVAGGNIIMSGYLFVYTLLPFSTIIFWGERIIIYYDDMG